MKSAFTIYIFITLDVSLPSFIPSFPKYYNSLLVILGLYFVLVDLIYFEKSIVFYKRPLSFLFSYRGPFYFFYYLDLDIFKVVLAEFVILSLISEVVNIDNIEYHSIA